MISEAQVLRDKNRELTDEVNHLKKLINSPVIDDFMKALPLESAHQALRWPAHRDANKSPWDWYWTLSYLAGKAVHAAVLGDSKKLKHHVITSAALLLTWYRKICEDEAAS